MLLNFSSTSVVVVVSLFLSDCLSPLPNPQHSADLVADSEKGKAKASVGARRFRWIPVKRLANRQHWRNAVGLTAPLRVITTTTPPRDLHQDSGWSYSYSASPVVARVPLHFFFKYSLKSLIFRPENKILFKQTHLKLNTRIQNFILLQKSYRIFKKGGRISQIN